MENFKIKKEKGDEIPDNYLFFTNIPLTPVYKRGVKDKIEEIAGKYRDLILNIHIFGAADIRCFLDANREIAKTYSDYILPGDILSRLYLNFACITQ
jgi:hypothetical protein